jgi:hypothetical protein
MILVLKYVRKIGFLGCSEIQLVRSRNRGVPSTIVANSRVFSAQTTSRYTWSSIINRVHVRPQRASRYWSA